MLNATPVVECNLDGEKLELDWSTIINILKVTLHPEM